MIADRKMLIKFLRTGLKNAREGMATWQEEYEKNVNYALTWCDDAIRWAAIEEVYTKVLDDLESGTLTVDAIKNIVISHTITMAKQPFNSLSKTTNIMQAEMASAWATIAEFMRR
jgi:beta-glucanase (GH16 family)